MNNKKPKRLTVNLIITDVLLILFIIVFGYYGHSTTVRLDAIGNILFASFGDQLCDCEECQEKRHDIASKAKSIEETTNARIRKKQNILWEDTVTSKLEEE